MAIYKSRALAPKEETWDLEKLLVGKTVEQHIKAVKDFIPRYIKGYKERFDSLEKFVDYHKSVDRLETITTPLHYLYLKTQEDKLSPLRGKLDEVEMILHPLHVAVAGEEAETLKNQKIVTSYLKDPRLSANRRHYEKVFRMKDHVLSENVAAFDAQIAQAYEDNETVFGVLMDSEQKFSPVKDKQGRKHEVTYQNFSELQRSKDRVLRKNSSDSLAAGQMAYKETFSRLLGGMFLASHTRAKALNFKNYVERSLFDDNIEPAFVQGLYKAAKEHVPSLQRHLKAERTLIGAYFKLPYSQVKPYDIGYSLFMPKKLYSVQEAIGLVEKSVEPLGEKYLKQVQKGFADRWVDFHMTPNKASGAFHSSWTLSAIRAVLVNFEGTLSSVTTLAHEMGHAMHSWSTSHGNHLQLAGYPIFTAEVASNFCELLLIDELLRTEKDDKVRFKAVENFLDNFAGSVFRQLAFSEYEWEVSKAVEQNRPPSSFKQFGQLYAAVNQAYAVHTDWDKEYGEARKMGAIYLPHYYYNFYVYKYAVGLIAAAALMAQLKRDRTKGARNYLAFINSGLQKWPADILKDAGADLTDKKTLDDAFALYDEYIDEYVRLGKRLLKVKAKL